MDLGVFELQIFVSLIVVLGAAFVALVCDYLKGSNEQLREHNIELRVRKDEQEHRGILDPGRWLEQLVGLTQTKAQSAAGGNEPRARNKAAEPNDATNSWANRQDLERNAQRGTYMPSRRTSEPRPAAEDWVSPEAMARAASNSGRQPDASSPEEGLAVAESKGDIRDEIQKLVESSPRPRRGRVNPPSAAAATVVAPAAATPEAGTGQPQPASAPGLAEPEQESLDASGSGVESVVPALELKEELERVAQSLHGVSSAAKLHRVTEAEGTRSNVSGAQQVSALLDEVIAASFQRGRRGPEPERQPGQPVTPLTSRPLLETKLEPSGAGLPMVPEATSQVAGNLQMTPQQVDVVVPVHALSHALNEAERDTPAPLVIPWQVESPHVESLHEDTIVPEPPALRTAEPGMANAIDAYEDIPPVSFETAFSWPPARPFHTSRAEPAKSAAVFQARFEPSATIDEPRDLTCFEEAPPTGIPQVPEPARFQAMIESISLMPVETAPVYDGPPVKGRFPGSDDLQPETLVSPPLPPPTQHEEFPEGAKQPDEHSPDAPVEDLSDLPLPAGMHNRPVFSRLMEAPGKLSGVIVSISLNDFKKIQESFTNQAFDDLMQSIDKLMKSMIRDQDFGVRLDESEWFFVFRNEVGAVAQKRILQISEKLWDFQLRSLGSVSILFGWGAVEVENERLSESYNAAHERMEQSRRGRKTVAMDVRGKRKVANG